MLLPYQIHLSPDGSHGLRVTNEFICADVPSSGIAFGIRPFAHDVYRARQTKDSSYDLAIFWRW